MSKYAFYIWSAYSVSGVGLFLLTAWVLRGYVRVKARLAELEGKKL